MPSTESIGRSTTESGARPSPAESAPPGTARPACRSRSSCEIRARSRRPSAVAPAAPASTCSAARAFPQPAHGRPHSAHAIHVAHAIDQRRGPILQARFGVGKSSIARLARRSASRPALRPTGSADPSGVSEPARRRSVHRQRMASPGPGNGCRSRTSRQIPSSRPISRTSSL